MMDPRDGELIPEDHPRARAWMTFFALGEVVTVKGEKFRIVRIEQDELALEPMVDRDRAEQLARSYENPEPRNRAERRRAEAMERRRQRSLEPLK